MSTLFSLLAAVLSFSYAFLSAAAFSFSFAQAPTSCDNLPITWTGGTPPFQLLIIPVFGTLRNVSIPASAFSNGQGSYSAQIPLPKDGEFMLMMSDATGFNTGGTTNILTVGASKGGSCNTTDPGVAFSYQLNTALQQCRPFTFGQYATAIQPVTIMAIVPGGNVITLAPPVGPTSFIWTAAVARGTSMVFVMTDAQGRPGGVSDIEIVTSSDDSTCLNSNSPTSTSSPPSTPTSATPSKTTSSSSGATTSAIPSPTATGTPSNGFSIAAIAGTVIGGLLFLALAITLGLFFLRKKQNENEGGGNHFRRHSRIVDPRLDLTYEPSNDHPYGMPATGAPLASPYPYSPGGGAAPSYPSDPFLDNVPSSSHGAVRSHAPSQYDAASMYTDARYAQSEVDQYDLASQYYSGSGSGGYQPSPSQTQLYPPAPRNYLPPNALPPSDPFNPNSQPMLPGTEFDPNSLHSSSSPSLPSRSMSQSQSTPQASSHRISTTTSAAQRKAAAAGVTPYKPTRFVLHTDVEDVGPPVEETEEIVELPPQYSERRAPVSAPSPAAGGHISPSRAHAGHLPGDESLLPYS